MSYEHEFTWQKGSPSTVIVTGTFDDWTSSVTLDKLHSGGFSKKVNLDRNTKIIYKYVVDGEWKVNEDLPTEKDSSGNTNNVFDVPAEEEPVASTVTSTVSSALASVGGAITAAVAAVAAPAGETADAQLPGGYISTPDLDSASKIESTTVDTATAPTDSVEQVDSLAPSSSDLPEKIVHVEKVVEPDVTSAEAKESVPTETSVVATEVSKESDLTGKDPLGSFATPSFIPPEQAELAADQNQPVSVTASATVADPLAAYEAPPFIPPEVVASLSHPESQVENVKPPTTALAAGATADPLAVYEAPPFIPPQVVASLSHPESKVEADTGPAPDGTLELSNVEEPKTQKIDVPLLVTENVPAIDEGKPLEPQPSPPIEGTVPAIEEPKVVTEPPKTEVTETPKETSTIPVSNGTPKKDNLLGTSPAQDKNSTIRSSRFSFKSDTDAPTENATPRKRKTSFLQKIKSAISPKKKEK